MSINVFEPEAMISDLSITPSPDWDRGNGSETRPGIEPSGRGDVVPNLPALAGTLALQGGEEVRVKLAAKDYLYIEKSLIERGVKPRVSSAIRSFYEEAL